MINQNSSAVSQGYKINLPDSLCLAFGLSPGKKFVQTQNLQRLYELIYQDFVSIISLIDTKISTEEFSNYEDINLKDWCYKALQFNEGTVYYIHKSSIDELNSCIEELEGFLNRHFNRDLNDLESDPVDYLFMW